MSNIDNSSNKSIVTYTNKSALSHVSQDAKFGFYIQARFPSTTFYFVNGERVIKTTPTSLLPLLTFLKTHTNTKFSQLRDITAIDHNERKLRFEVVYFLLCLNRGITTPVASTFEFTVPQRLCISVSIAEGASLPSVTSLYPSAG